MHCHLILGVKSLVYDQMMRSFTRPHYVQTGSAECNQPHVVTWCGLHVLSAIDIHHWLVNVSVMQHDITDIIKWQCLWVIHSLCCILSHSKTLFRRGRTRLRNQPITGLIKNHSWIVGIEKSAQLQDQFSLGFNWYYCTNFGRALSVELRVGQTPLTVDNKGIVYYRLLLVCVSLRLQM